MTANTNKILDTLEDDWDGVMDYVNFLSKQLVYT